MDASQANSMLNSFDEEMEDFELEVSHREGTQLITFILGSEKYGLKILKVRELISYPEVMTRIPGMPDFIVGMIDTLTVRERLCIRVAPFSAMFSLSASVRPTAPQRTRVVVERSVQRALLPTIALARIHAHIQ